jgi:hypothetical protein
MFPLPADRLPDVACADLFVLVTTLQQLAPHPGRHLVAASKCSRR